MGYKGSIYAAIRKPDDGSCEFALSSEYGYSRKDATDLARNHNRNNTWAKANPVVRIALLRVEEIEEG